MRRFRASLALPLPAAQATTGPLAISGLRAWRLREPDSGRRYTVVKIDSQSGTSGYGEGGPCKSADLADARAAVSGRKATALEYVRSRLDATPSLEAAVGSALIDLMARSTGVPVYQYLGGPVRFKVRLMARLPENPSAEVVTVAKQRGFRVFTMRVPPRQSMSRLQAWVDLVRKTLDGFKQMAGADAEVVFDGAGILMPGDAAVVARALESSHPIWFDEPTNIQTTDALSRLSDESVMPVGLGRAMHNITEFQNLLRFGSVDIVRPSLGVNSLHKIRRIAAIAETHYIAIAPFNDGGPLATMMGIHSAASLTNAYVQEAPIPASARDRAMRAEILGGTLERADNGFAVLVNQPGLGVKPDEQAMARYSEEVL